VIRLRQEDGAMIAGCPTCAARYRIDTAKLRPEGARLRCSRCETVFRVQPSAESPATPAPTPAARTAPSAPASVPARAGAAPARPAKAADPARTVLVAHPEVALGKTLADALQSWGLTPLLVHDGVEALLQIQRTLPRAVVLDAALPKMFGFQVCEMMKRNEQLRSIPVVLIGAIHRADRYRRPPEEIYGADAYLERQQLPDGLAELLVRFGVQSAAPAPAPAVRRPAPPTPAPTAPAAQPAPAPRAPRAAQPTAPAAQPAPAPRAPRAAQPTAPAATGAPAATAGAETEKAQRLARIIVSDVILYNAAKFEAAVRAGNVVDALSAELEEGYALFSQRVDPRQFDPREHLQRELGRVARSRGMK
jgi:predicted Zn finger-like uncharacterized protein